MSELPTGWELSTLGGIGRYINGRGFKKVEWRDSGRPIIRIQNLTGSSKSTNYFDGEVDARHEVSPGDLLVSWAATLGVFVWSGQDAVLNQHIFKVQSQIDPDFHRYLLEFVLADLKRQTQGSGMVHITKGKFEATEVPLPPLPEQRRIVAAIEEHFSRLDAAQVALQRALVRAEHLVRSKREQEFGEENELFAIEEIADEAPRSLAIGPFGSNLKVADYRERGVPLVFVRDIRRREFGGDGTRFVDLEKAAALDAHSVRHGDVLVTKMGDPPGDVALYEGPDAIITADCIKISPGPSVRADFLMEALQTSRAQREILSITKGVAQRKVSLGRFRKSVFVPKPELTRQCQIVESIQSMAEITSRMSGEVNVALSKLTALRRSVLAAAFSGRLASQDPSDEPASMLLERIAAERAAAKTPRKKKALK